MKALVLSGSGFKFGFHVGVSQELEAQGHKFDMVLGSSGGGIITALLAYLPPDEIAQLLPNLKQSDFWVQKWWSVRGLYDSTPLRKYLKKVTKGRSLRQPSVVTISNRDDKFLYYLDTAGNFVRDDAKVIRVRDFMDYAYATAAIPGIVIPVEDSLTGNKSLVDGGLLEMTPLARAIELGADEIYVSLAFPYPQIESPYNDSLGWISDLVDAYEMMRREVFKEDIEKCLDRNLRPKTGDRIIKVKLMSPTKDLPGTVFGFKKEEILADIQTGRNMARAERIRSFT